MGSESIQPNELLTHDLSIDKDNICSVKMKKTP